MQYSTREVFPDQPDDVLCIDATSLYRPGVDSSERSRLLLRGLTSVKKAIAKREWTSSIEHSRVKAPECRICVWSCLCSLSNGYSSDS